MMLLEGTGHIGVGSCVNANNAQVAAMVGADMVLVANGGVGSAFDDLDLNYNMCKSNGVRIAGVVINKVMPDKIDQTKNYMSKVRIDEGLEKRTADNATASGENHTREYFSTRYDSTITTAIILNHQPNPFLHRIASLIAATQEQLGGTPPGSRT